MQGVFRKRVFYLKPSRAAMLTGGGLLAALLLLYLHSRHHNGVTPTTVAVFTSTRCVTSLAVAPDGMLWAGTTGGVLWHSPDGGWRKFTRLDGLPSHETRRLQVEGDPQAVFPRACARWHAQQWRIEPVSATADIASPDSTLCTAVWHGIRCEATVMGLRLHIGKTERMVALPKSKGSHISALLPHGDSLWAALFGDGIWAFDGKSWQPLDVRLPAAAREITAMVEDAGILWVGTRRAGLWSYDGSVWKQSLQPDEPYNHNCQALIQFAGNLYVSTLEDGLVVRTPHGWAHVWAPTIASNAPRQMVVFGGALYLRHGSGKVDRFDGTRWTRNICARLPRGETTAIATEAQRLYVAQWGGWSEFDGRAWTSHLDNPDLQGFPITALLPDGDTLWIGTQTRGLAAYSHATGRLRWYDERDGLPDDWVTAIARSGGNIDAGTFVGGLAQYRGSGWTSGSLLNGQNVTALVPDEADGLYIATRNGVWHQAHDGTLTLLNRRAAFLDTEAQCLCAVEGGLWIGTRTGLYFLPSPPSGP